MNLAFYAFDSGSTLASHHFTPCPKPLIVCRKMPKTVSSYLNFWACLSWSPRYNLKSWATATWTASLTHRNFILQHQTFSQPTPKVKQCQLFVFRYAKRYRYRLGIHGMLELLLNLMHGISCVRSIFWIL